MSLTTAKGRFAAALGLIATASAVTVGCAGGDRGELPPKKTVVITENGYEPRVVRVPVGGRVTWVNREVPLATVQTENAPFYAYDRERLARRGGFDLHTLRPGEAESLTFATAGRYEYYSSYDNETRGLVIVREERAPATGRAP